MNGIEIATIYLLVLVCTLAVLALALHLCYVTAQLLVKLKLADSHDSPFITPGEADQHKAAAAVAVLHHVNHIDHSSVAVAAAAALHRFNSTDMSAIAVAAAVVVHATKE